MKIPVSSKQSPVCHVAAMPYPGRGHINPIFNLCKQAISFQSLQHCCYFYTHRRVSQLPQLRGFSGKNTLRFNTKRDPSERGRAAEINGFLEAVWTKMEKHFEFLLDQLEQPASVIIANSLLYWAVGVGNRRNIPVASFWPMSAMVFSIFENLDLLVQSGHCPVDLIDKGKECVDFIPGVSSTRLMDLPSVITGNDQNKLLQFCRIFSWMHKAQYLLITSIYELEPRAIDALKAKFQLTIYTVGPAIPLFKLGDNSCLGPTPTHSEVNYAEWLNSQPDGSVLYVAFGSFHSLLGSQMEEIAAGLSISGVRFLWVVREQQLN